MRALATLAVAIVAASALAVPATPAVATPTGITAAAEVPPVASESEKLRAARTLGVVPTDAMLLLRDKEFVIALWRQATGAEVRASAELAFAGTDLACTEWIKSGIISANERDQAQQMRDAEAARVAREAKEAAAIVLGVQPEPELLIQNDRDFLFTVFGRVGGPRVRAAILAALAGTSAERKELIANGLRTAHAGDQQDAIDADQQATEAEKARKAAEAARGRAVTVVRVVPTPDIVSLPDDDVLRVIADGARPGSEVEKAAVTALRSRVRADWKRFVDSGVYEANWRDVAAVLAQKAEADRALVDDIRHQAVVGGIRPRLARAAERALAGGVDDVRAFLDQGQYDALTQSFSRNAINGNIAGQYLRETAGGVVVQPGAAEPAPGEGLDATWRVVDGLAGADCFSLESTTKPNHYLARYYDGKKTQVAVQPANGTVDFDWNATWCVDNILPGAGVTLRGGADFLTRQADGRAGVGIEFYWWVTEPLPDSTEITVNWLNKYLPDYDPYTDLLVSPLGPEQVDGPVRYRDFQRRSAPGQVAFRSYWSRGGAVHPLTAGRGTACASPELLATYLRLGGHPALGVPVTDEACTSDKAGRFVNFAGGGSIYSIDRAGAHAVLGAIRDKWVSLGAEKSTLGYPTADEVAIPGGRRGTFERGRIDYDTATGVATVYPAS
ncbi:LGFP repeat-containing protein [Amycolatopsis pretoriensis]|uniref:LGFP repeat-containing protein n=1 Tax=Amycolatopsis pretoriensis TaxID=218821 RepID=A0A1H5RDT3_9PSEU|nr:AbfB domain-containing protein [Amycolatopsis pretoriensis]SEF35778.1 LGFP repeat-containing protein [Amycolatopsis pretoriensis]